MASYLDRYCKVLDYIDDHLSEELSVERLSQFAGLSKYHFHRQFSAFFNLSMSTYIKLLRFKRASYQLAFRPEIKVIDIALSCGYESSEAFSRAFKEMIGQNPSNFRNAPDWSSWHEKKQILDQLRSFRMHNENTVPTVNIIDFEEIQIAALEHKGSPEKIGSTINQFIEWRKENRLPPSISRTFNLYHNDPNIIPSEDFHFDICASIKTAVAPNDYGVITKVIPAGRCAVIRYIGSDANLEQIAKYLYSDWLDASGEELRDFPLFIERIKFFPDVPEHESVLDIYLPLK